MSKFRQKGKYGRKSFPVCKGHKFNENWNLEFLFLTNQQWIERYSNTTNNFFSVNEVVYTFQDEYLSLGPLWKREVQRKNVLSFIFSELCVFIFPATTQKNFPKIREVNK